MAKSDGTKQKKKKKKAAAANKAAKPVPAAAPAKAKPVRTAAAKKAKTALTSAKAVAQKLSDNPIVLEVVAAALVASAAALRDPAKARALAAAAANELETVAEGAAGRAGALWQLALDIARKSLDAIGADLPAPKKRGKGGE